MLAVGRAVRPAQVMVQNSLQEGSMASNLPDYVAAAQPVPPSNRIPWYKSTAQTYAGIMLWFVFWQSVPRREPMRAAP